MAINLGSNFNLGASLPLDERTVVADTTARDALTAIYEGMIVYVEADETYYSYDGSSWEEFGGSASSSGYTGSGYSSTLGEAVSGLTTVEEALDLLFDFTYLSPQVSLSASGQSTIREVGDTVTSSTLTATTTKRSDDIAMVVFYLDGALINTVAVPDADGGTETYAWTGSFSDDAVFRVDVTDDGTSGGPTTVSASKTFNFVYPYYYGIGTAGLSAASVAALTKDIVVESTNKSVSYGATSSEVYYFAYPASYGTLSSILDENGFETIADWTLTVDNITGLDATAQSYNIYEFNNTVTSPATDYTFIQ